MSKRRRGQNEGSIFQRKDGRWCGTISLGRRDNGRTKRKYFYGTTAAEVQEAMTKAKGDVLRGLPVAVERQMVGQFLERWLEQSVKPTVRQLTYEQYTQHVNLYLAPKTEHEDNGRKVEVYRPLPALGAIPLAKLGPQHVEAFRNEQLKAHGRLKKPLSPRTVQLSLVILRRALDQAVKRGLAARNVAKLVDLPRVPRHEIRPFTEDQVRSFLAAIKGERFEAAYMLAVTLGLRRGELLGLRWRDIDLDARTLTVAQAVSRVGGKRFGGVSELRFVEPKSARSRRTIPIPESVAVALREHRARHPGVADRLVFTTGNSTPFEPRALNADFIRTLGKAELPTVRLHDLRHSAASLMLAQGVHPRVVMEILGHSQISLTMNTYSHVVPSILRDAADKMNQLVAGA